jgi:protein SCO1/2
MNSRYFVTALALVIALAAGLIAYTFVQKETAEQQVLTAMILPDGRELPGFSLLDQTGQAVSREVFDGHWNLVFFGFTSCPDICPMTLQVLRDAKQKLADAGEPLPRIVLVSVDPERDTPDVLGRYVDAFGDGNLGLTGDIEEIRKLTKDLGIFFEKRESGVDNYTVDHSAVVLIINPEGRLHGLFSAPHKAANFVNDMPRIMAGS